ncbi:MAG: outer membrane beta-barrel protein [candidate division Zixibacteria bacterium]|nr:outer membrane beta-barrel protein [candidate division Zixibacteria bacterium]
MLLCVSAVLLVVGLSESADAQYHQRDRFGLRGGIWPHTAIEGSLGERDYASPRQEVYILDARVDEPASIVPFVEVYGLFHLKNRWWLEGSAGWAGRGGLEVGGFGAEDSILLGRGRIDFFPLFAGMRYIRPLNPDGNPHNVYARAGGSVVFANEGADLLQDSITTYGIYSPGTEAAFGFLVGGGGEFYFTRKFGVLLDATYRYTNFKYARDAEFNLSNIWLSLGLIFRSR